MTRAAVAANRNARDEAIIAYNIRQDGGLYCPLCRAWCSVDILPTLGVHLHCRECGTETVIPRAPLLRAIKRREAVR